MLAISDEKCKPFTIHDTKDQNYTPPVNLTPADKKIFTENESKAPITFRWTPLVPKPAEPVTYRLRVWQLMQGQNGVSAMRSDEPQIVKDGITDDHFTVESLIQGPCKPPYMCDFVWDVQAFSSSGKIVAAKKGGSAGWDLAVNKKL